MKVQLALELIKHYVLHDDTSYFKVPVSSNLQPSVLLNQNEYKVLCELKLDQIYELSSDLLSVNASSPHCFVSERSI